MDPEIVALVLEARRALAELSGALMARAPHGDARIAIARASDDAHEAIRTQLTAAGQHPLDPRRT